MCGYELSTNLQSFAQKDLTKKENIVKIFKGPTLFRITL